MLKLTYEERFVKALEALTDPNTTIPTKLVAEWINGESDELQSWAVSNQVFNDWAMGISILDACHILASQPMEGMQDVINYSRPKYRKLLEENEQLKIEIAFYRDLVDGDDYDS